MEEQKPQRNSIPTTATATATAAMKKKTLGRQKIEIKKLEKKSSKQVTFSKRRAGLFKKAGELSVLCGAEVAIIVFSPNDKLFCFGHPGVDVLLDRFLSGDLSPPAPAESYVPVAEFNRDYAALVAGFEAEKRRAAELVDRPAGMGGGFWWETAVDGMRVEELKEFRSALVDLRGRVAERVEKLTAERIGRPPFPELPSASQFQLAGNHHVATGLGIF